VCKVVNANISGMAVRLLWERSRVHMQGKEDNVEGMPLLVRVLKERLSSVRLLMTLI